MCCDESRSKLDRDGNSMILVEIARLVATQDKFASCPGYLCFPNLKPGSDRLGATAAPDDVLPFFEPESCSRSLTSPASSIRAAGSRIIDWLVDIICGVETEPVQECGRWS